MKLSEKDHAALTQFQADYSRLLEKWKNATPYSQEVANVDVMFKSLERRIGAAVGDGLFQRILDAAGVAIPPKPFPAPGKWFPVDVTGTRPMREHAPGKWELAAWPSDGVTGTPAHSKSEYKRRVAQGDPNVLPPLGHNERRIAELTVALEESQRLLAFAGCPTDWIDKVLLAAGVGGCDGS